MVLDDPTLLALGYGNHATSSLIVRGHRNPELRLLVPTLCVMEADRKREGVGVHIGSLEMLHTVDLGFDGALVVAALSRKGLALGIAHAVHTAQPAPERPDGAVIATVAPENYEGTKVRIMDLNQ
jgi:hypothetical protein